MGDVRRELTFCKKTGLKVDDLKSQLMEYAIPPSVASLLSQGPLDVKQAPS